MSLKSYYVFIQVCSYVFLYAAELLGGHIAAVLLEHHLDVLQRVLETSHLIMLLCLMSPGTVNLRLPLLTQQITHL